MSLLSPVIDYEPSYVDLDETGPRVWCADCQRMTVHGFSIDRYPLCLSCDRDEVSVAETADQYPAPSNEALELMERQGGSFVKALAHCYLMADPENRLRLRTSMADWFANYEARVPRVGA